MLLIHCLSVVGVLVTGAVSSPSWERHPHVHQRDHTHAVYRIENTTTSPNLTVTNPRNLTAPENSTLLDAESIVAEAVQQQGVYNVWRLENPLQNTYRSRSSSPGPSTKWKRDDEPVAPHVNATVLAAAALIANRDALAQAANGTLNPPLPFKQTDLGSNAPGNLTKRAGSTQYWVPNVARNGMPPMGGPGYPFATFRDVTDPQYAGGAKGDGIHDDTAAINAAIAADNNCGANCLSSSVKGTLIWFPAGTYLISSPINAYYYSQLVGDADNLPTIKTSANFIGFAAIQTDVYIPGGNSSEWYIEQSNFYRQVRNFNIDVRAASTAGAAGLHWQVAQATSLLNVNIFASATSGTTQVGMYTENGSSGFMSDVSINGGQYGLYGGNQQYTVRSFEFSGQTTAAICLIWDWGWTWADLIIESTPIGILLINPKTGQQAGSTYVMDSVFIDVGTAIKANPLKQNLLQDSIITLDNCVFGNAQQMITYSDGSTVPVPSGGTVSNMYFGNVQIFNGTGITSSQGVDIAVRPPDNSLLNQSPPPLPNTVPTPHRDPYFYRSRPQYGNLVASDMLNVKSYGAKGDGVTDDTAAVQKALNAAALGNVIYFPTGSYIITSTLNMPTYCRITGRIWSQLVAKGPAFADIAKPTPMLRVGNPGDVGTIEISDMLFTSIGPLPGLVMVEWNIAEETQGSVGMWDTHFRVGGAQGTDLSLANCPTSTTLDSMSNCWAAAMLLHLTNQSSGYFENMWAWVADHDIDDPKNAQITVGVGRGLLIESQGGPVWLYGTASEHSIMYQYNFLGATNVFAGMIQTESPYYQGVTGSTSPGPWYYAQMNGDPQFYNDPSCTAGADMCQVAWAVTASETVNVTIAGAGLYSWFADYNQAVCVDAQDCQQRLFFDNGDNDAMVVSNLVTIGAVEMYSVPSTNEIVLAKTHTQGKAHPFWSMLGLYYDTALPQYTDCDTTLLGCNQAPPCDYNINFETLDDLAAANVDPFCLDWYTMTTLQNMLWNGMANVSNVDDGFSDEYSYYLKYLAAQVVPAMEGFLNFSETATGQAAPGWQYFNCKYDSGNTHINHPCPFTQAEYDSFPFDVTLTMVLTNSTGFYDATMDLYGLSEGQLTLDNTYTPAGACIGRDCPPLNRQYHWAGFPTISPNFNNATVDPETIMFQAQQQMGNVSHNLAMWQANYLLGNALMSYSNLTEVISGSIFMFLQAIDSVAQAKEIGKKYGDELREDRIKLILSMVFMCLSMLPNMPFIAAPLLSGIRLIGVAGNTGMAVQDWVEYPHDAALDFLAIITAGGVSDARTLTELAGVKDALDVTSLSKFGALFGKLDGTLSKADPKASCKA